MLKTYSQSVYIMTTKAIPSITISPSQLAELLETITRSTVVSLTYVVDDTRSKVSKGIYAIQKKVHISHLYLNHDYEKKVINLTGDTSFQAQALKGKTRICSTLLRSDKNDELLIDGNELNSATSHIVALYHDKMEITEQDGIDNDWWRPSFYNPAPEITAGRGSVDHTDNFYIVNTALAKIVELKFGGVLYKIQ